MIDGKKEEVKMEKRRQKRIKPNNHAKGKQPKNWETTPQKGKL